MGVFKNGEEVAHYLGGIFETAFKDPELSAKFKAVDTVLRVEYSDPESVTTVDFTNGVVDSTTYFVAAGGSGGNVQEFKVGGTAPVWKVEVDGDGTGVAATPTEVVLVGHFGHVAATYAAMLKEEGRSDLLAV